MASNDGVTLTVLRAPAGAGKTVLAREWVDTLVPATWVWLAAGRRDDVGSLLDGLCTGVARIEPAAMAARSLARSGATADDISAALAEALAGRVGAPVLTVVLDDLHLVSAPVVAAVLGPLLDRCAGRLHLVALTRERLLAPLGKARALGQVAEVEPGALAFTPREAGRLVSAAAGRPVSTEVAADIAAHCEGWPVGLRLAGAALPPESAAGEDRDAAVVAGFDGSHPAVWSFFREEVLGVEPDDVQDLLLDLSVLDRFDGELCDAVTARGDGVRAVRDLVDRGLFVVPAESSHPSGQVRFQRLFAEFLRNTLEERPKERPLLEARAARALSARGDAAGALGHALGSGDQSLIVDLVIAHHTWLTDRGRAALVRAAIAAVSDDTMMADLSRAAECAFALGYAGLPAEALHLIDRIGSAAGADPAVVDRVQTMRALGSAAAGFLDEALATKSGLGIEPSHPVAVDDAGSRLPLWMGRAFTAAGRFDEARTRLIPCLASCGRTSLPAYVVRGAIAELLVAEGRLGEAQGESARALEEWRADGSPPLRGILDAVRARAELLHQAGSLSDAERLVEEVVVELDGFPRIGSSTDVLTVALQCELALAGGRPREVLDRIDAAAVDWRAFPPGPQFDARIAEVEARAALRVGDPVRLDLARTRLAQPAAQVIGARAAIERGDRAGAAASLLEIRPDAPLPRRIEAELLRAQVAGDAEARVRHVLRALELGLAAGYRAIFAEEPAITPVVLGVVGHDEAGAVIRRIAAAVGDHPRRTPEDLTERERGVLDLLPTHLTNQEMATRLYLSLNTVKTHLKSLYRKLGVTSRSEAVTEAQARGWL